jgi:hypothetical protein
VEVLPLGDPEVLFAVGAEDFSCVVDEVGYVEEFWGVTTVVVVVGVILVTLYDCTWDEAYV